MIHLVKAMTDDLVQVNSMKHLSVGGTMTRLNSHTSKGDLFSSLMGASRFW